MLHNHDLALALCNGTPYQKTATLSEWANSKYEGLVRQFDGFANESFFFGRIGLLQKRQSSTTIFVKGPDQLVLVES